MAGYNSIDNTIPSGIYGHYAEINYLLPSGVYNNYVEINNITSFNGNFASLFTGVLQSVQTDLGLTYGGTLLATGTTPPVITLTGSLSTVPVPITVNCTLLGIRGVWTGTYSFDGGSTTTAFTSAATVPLTGKGTGLTLNIATGTAAINDVWTATCSALADQSGNTKDYSQAVLSKQPTVSVGVNGIAGLRFTIGSQQVLTSALNLPAPGTTPTWIGMVFKNVTAVGVGRPICDTSSGLSQLVYNSIGDSTYQQYNGNPGNGDTFPLNNWECDEIYFSNSTSDYYKRGSHAVATGNGAGNATGTGRSIGGCDAVSIYCDIELVSLIYTSSVQPAAIANWKAAITAKYGASISV